MSDPDVRVKNSNDQLIHQSITKIFRDRCLVTSDQIKEFLRTPEHEDSIIKLILDLEPAVRQKISLEYKSDHISLLFFTVICNYLDSAELLVRSGADVNQTFVLRSRNPEHIDEKCTILDALIYTQPSPERERLIHLVIDHGADLQIQNHLGGTALHHAMYTGQVQVAKTILENGGDVNVNVPIKKNAYRRHKGLTPLLIAAKNRKADELVPLLIRHGADVFAKDDYRRNALHMLSLAPVEHASVARALIDKGVSPLDEMSPELYQPIHLAALERKNELAAVLKTLLERGADVDQRTIEGRTALHRACSEQLQEESIGLLVSAGADVLVEDNNGDTPFALVQRENMENPSIMLMVKALALKKACLPSIELKAERIIKEYPTLWNHYQDCRAHISRMKFTRFVRSCTFYELLAKSHSQIAALMRDPNFEANFELYDLDGFSTYAEDIRRALKRARNHYNSVLEQEDLIDEAVYKNLPWMVLRRVVHHIFNI